MTSSPADRHVHTHRHKKLYSHTINVWVCTVNCKLCTVNCKL
jgi:hypothetical protein